MATVVEDLSKGAGTRFPFINLESALGRAKQLYDADPKGREMAIAAVFITWGYSAKSSGGFQTISALKEYGLLRSTGAGKIQLSPEVLIYFRDERESEHERLRMYFAHRPRLVQKLWIESKWGASPPADPVARSHLKNDIGLSEQSARSFLAIYKENIAFAGFKGDDKVHGPVIGQSGDNKPPLPSTGVKVGDYVQWTSSGVEQFKIPRRVVGFFDDQHAQVFGSNTGVSVSELTVVPAPSVDPTVERAAETRVDRGSAGAQGLNDFNVLQRGNRLQITADVDLEGIETLKEMLNDYESILRRLGTKKSN